MNLDRYDDRDDIRVNLINLLIHREFSNAFPAKFIIEKDRVYIENANRARVVGEIDPSNFSPYPKNPVFKTIIPLNLERSTQATPQVGTSSEDYRTEEILQFCREPKSRKEIQHFVGIKDRKDFYTRILNPLVKGGLLKLTIPDKPTSPKQKYHSER